MPELVSQVLALPWLRATLVLLAAAAVGFAAQAVLLAVLRRIADRTPYRLDNLLVKRCAGPVRLGLPLLAIALARPAAFAHPPEALAQVLRVGSIVVVAWLLVRVCRAGEDTLVGDLDLQARDNLRARRVQTQVGVLRRIATFGIWLVATGTALLSFETFRQVGAGLLTSAGIAGIVVGFAAQKTLGSVLAGIQIALTQPIRLDDVVIVEGQWGRIEEITLTYVVVKIWDERRLVVPIDWFLTNAFENWTRTSAELLGTVYLKVDHAIDFGGLRDALREAVEGSQNWDRRLWRLHVTDTSEKAVEVRALVSAADSGAAWDLRCEVREALVRWVAEHHPEALPRLRAEVGELPGRGGSGGEREAAQDGEKQRRPEAVRRDPGAA